MQALPYQEQQRTQGIHLLGLSPKHLPQAGTVQEKFHFFGTKQERKKVDMPKLPSGIAVCWVFVAKVKGVSMMQESELGERA